VREVAVRLNITETSAAWHLFDARKKIKKELETMKNENTYVYKPGSLHMGAVGEVPQKPDIDKINDSLIRQNICLLCRKDGKTIDELAGLIGISKPYLEFDLDWLVDREFLSFDGRRYQTTFIIMDKKHFEYRKDLYLKNKNLYKNVTDYLWANESKIRAISFYGSDFPSEKLMWAVLSLFWTYAHKNGDVSQLNYCGSMEIHKDGGKYNYWAYDFSNGNQINVTGFYDNSGWEKYGAFTEESKSNIAYWFGLYNFADSCPEIIKADKTAKQFLHKLYCATLNDDFSQNNLSGDEKEKLAEAVECGLILKDGDSYKPNFVVFTREQLDKLYNEIFAPFLPEIVPKFIELIKQFYNLHKADFPQAKQGVIEHHTIVDLFSSSLYFFILAAEENKLWLPKTPEEGAPLTLVLVK
jgi:hypothetical protein